jgi:K+-sensing histidine kinase KdpD
MGTGCFLRGQLMVFPTTVLPEGALSALVAPIQLKDNHNRGLPSCIFYERVEALKAIILSLGVLLLVSYIDYATSDQFLFFVFYFIPVALCAWHVGRPAGLGMAFLSGIAWWLAERLGGHHYSSEFFSYWNGSICFVAFAVIGLVVGQLKQTLDRREQTNAELAKTLADLQHSTEKIRELQDGLQVVCAWTKQIQVQGKWISIEEFLTRHLNIQLTHGIAPEAVRALVEESEGESGKTQSAAKTEN